MVASGPAVCAGLIPQRGRARVIQEGVAHYFGLSVTDILGPTRLRRIAWPRFIAIALVRDFTGMGLVDLGFCFAGRDHTTIKNALGRADQLRGTVPDFQAAYAELSGRLRADLSTSIIIAEGLDMNVSRTPDQILEAVCTAVGVQAVDVKNAGARIADLGVARRLFSGLAHYSCGMSAVEIAESLGFARGTVKRWLHEHNARRAGDPSYSQFETAARRDLGLDVGRASVAPRAADFSVLSRVAHPKWSPAQDLALMALRGAGDPLDVVAGKLCRQGAEVTRRYHQLRSVPGVMDALVALQEAGGDMSAPIEVAA